MPDPAPSPEVLLVEVRAALEEMKAKDSIEIDVRGRRFPAVVAKKPLYKKP